MIIKVKHCCSTVVCAKVTRHPGHITVANVDGNYVWISLHVSNIFICENEVDIFTARVSESELLFVLYIFLDIVFYKFVV